jgi:uncharacterized protein
MLGEFSPLHRPPAGGEYYVFRDVVHNLIEIEDADDGLYIRKLLRTPEVQRMRRIRQNGLGSLIYSSLETTRFPHALGSFHIARRIADSLLERQPKQEEGFPQCLQLTKRDCLAFSVAALLHDIGHGPLSHTWEECFKYSHEKMGTMLLGSAATSIGQYLADDSAHPKYPGIGHDILNFLRGQHRLEYLLPLLEGNLDVDRLDFISRDTRSAGVTYGFHELEWIIRSFRFARLPARYLNGAEPRWVIAIDGRKGLSTLVQFLHARENMYRLVYHHKTTRAATQMLLLLFRRARHLADDNKLLCESGPLREALYLKESDSVSLECLLQLDDSDIWISIKGWARDQDGDAILRDLSQQLLARDLFKVFILSDEVYERLRSMDIENSGSILKAIVKARLGCSQDEAGYYYAFDSTTFDVIGRSQGEPWLDVWVMQSGALGFEFQTLRDYWHNKVQSAESATQNLLLVHPEVVQDLTSVVERLSFPAESASKMKKLPQAPAPYRLVAPLGSEGAWKEVWVGVASSPGSAPEKMVALKRYKTADEDGAAIERDVTAINLLSDPHPNLSSPRLLLHEGRETWIMEPLWTGSLEDLTRKQGPRRDIVEIVDIAQQLFSGLARLHEHNLRHTDIKPDNCGVLVGGNGRRDYLLGDFGCVSSTPTKMPADPRLLGTLRTRAPEVIAGKSISTKSDVWAMGATIYALCLRKYPFMSFDAPHHDSADRNEREAAIVVGLDSLIRQLNVSVDRDLPPIVGEQLAKCFEIEEKRPTAKDLADAFRKIQSELSASKNPLFRTAWQRAEDVASCFCLNARTGPVAVIDDRAEEVKNLIGEFTPFVPKRLQESLAPLVQQL